jgi:hypothetical protein
MTLIEGLIFLKGRRSSLLNVQFNEDCHTLEATALRRPKDLKCMYLVEKTNFVKFKGRKSAVRDIGSMTMAIIKQIRGYASSIIYRRQLKNK